MVEKNISFNFNLTPPPGLAKSLRSVLQTTVGTHCMSLSTSSLNIDRHLNQELTFDSIKPVAADFHSSSRVICQTPYSTRFHSLSAS